MQFKFPFLPVILASLLSATSAWSAECSLQDPNSRSLLIDAILSNDAACIQKAMSTGSTVNDVIQLVRGPIYNRREQIVTPLGHASELGNIESMKALIQLGANVNSGGSDTAPPLTLAAAHTQIDAMALLLKNGANVNLKDYLGQSPLMNASGAYNAEKALVAVKMLKEAGASINESAYMNESHKPETALDIALRKGNMALAQYLISQGAKRAQELGQATLKAQDGSPNSFTQSSDKLGKLPEATSVGSYPVDATAAKMR